jgi:hypothetical protein
MIRCSFATCDSLDGLSLDHQGQLGDLPLKVNNALSLRATLFLSAEGHVFGHYIAHSCDFSLHLLHLVGMLFPLLLNLAPHVKYLLGKESFLSGGALIAVVLRVRLGDDLTCK